MDFNERGKRKSNFYRVVGITSLLIFLITNLAQVYGQNPSPAHPNNHVRGVVFHDKSSNGIYNKGTDKPLEGIAVSNGREIAVTDHKGVYELPLRDSSVIFVIKPQDWKVPVDEHQLPQFYHVHSTHNLSGSNYKGLDATGPLPESVDFPLYPVEEPEQYKALIFGDTQPRDEDEVYYLVHDVITELIGTDAAFGVTLGDIVFDNLDLFESVYGSIGKIGIPWRHLLGNHDLDYTGADDMSARGPYLKDFGPSYYAFSYGPAHFIVLDNIEYVTEGDDHYYQTGLGEYQMEFLRNELSRIDEDQLLFIMAHIPWAGSTGWKDESEREAFFQLLAEHPNAVSLVAHHHRHYHHILGEDFGFPEAQPHHMICVGTSCGAWWTGVPDEYGIPHALMTDGTPNGYAFLHIDENDWKMSWKAASRSADFQMHVHVPNKVDVADLSDTTVMANIFNALPSARVQMRIGESGTWIDMDRVTKQDPTNIAAFQWESELEDYPWRSMEYSFWGGHVSEYIWEGDLPAGLNPGFHVIHVRAVDDWWEYKGRRIMKVKKKSP